ncbi:LOW QUALITY PROTEIN: hypothetical protein Cgig2_031931 [Carnegiea gigantea]|uniref:DUF4283 domain-containing protein n=1 Tax=Carnegiea gigantea TaxID=171969 RepID=A0A9Q1GNS8_9CARY|nr:LOW QUALITY PROTEIN: hypothetical protein Cgig2_031931 [Carnegiea gigantea]
MARGGRRGRPKVLREITAKPISPPASQEAENPIDGNISRVLTISPQQLNETVPVREQSANRMRPSYAPMVDANEGTSLEFIPVTEINGIKCAKFVEEDVAQEIAYWQNAVRCCVLGVNPLIEVIDGYVRRIWTGYEIDKVLLIKKGLYLVRFNELKDAMVVAQKGVFHFDQKPFIVRTWNPEMDINIDTITSLPIWIQLHELDIKYWGLQSLSKIRSILGIPLKTDKYTKDKSMRKYARLLVEMPLEGHFPEYIENGELNYHRQHLKVNISKNRCLSKLMRKPVTRHTARHQILSNVGQGSSTPATEKLLANTFSALMEAEAVQAKEGEGEHTPNG